MPVFYALKDIADAQPQQVGEMARMLHQLQQEGCAIPVSWVMPAVYFERSLTKLTAREPLFADWPQLLWQTPRINSYSGQQLAKRLRQPLAGLPLDLPLQPLLDVVGTSVVRLLPSLWIGEGYPSADLVQMMTTRYCWADVGTLEAAIKNLWMDMISAPSLAYWRYWRQGVSEGCVYPKQIGLAVIAQRVEPVSVSGTLTVRSDRVTVQAVQGLPTAIVESCPDSYEGSLPDTPQFTWTVGYQELSYQPAEADESPQLASCLTSTVIGSTASELIAPTIAAALLTLARQLNAWTAEPVQVEWCLPTTQSPSLQIFQALRWPRVPASQKRLWAAPAAALQELVGQPASPGRAIGQALVIAAGTALPTSARDHILVVSEVFPDWLPLLKTSTAVISERGGLTCHAAILARELGLPAVIGVADATQHIHTGDVLQLDGDRGQIKLTDQDFEAIAAPAPPQFTGADHRTEIWLNLSQPDLAHTLAVLPVAGVGLLRSEWLMMPVLNRQHPYWWIERGKSNQLLDRLIMQLRPILQAFAPRPVRYRSLDIRSNEFAQLEGAPAVEPNPMLGIRGAFSYQQQPKFFELELQLLKRLQDEGYTNLQLLLPFVRTVEEVQYCQRIISEARLDQVATFELWMMAEVPSVLFLLDQYVAAGIQGIAIGVSDLTQLLLGIDRDQAIFSTHFDNNHVAVQRAIAQIIQQANALQLPCTLCGVPAAQHSDLIMSVVQQGITGISVDAAAIETTVQAVQRAEALLASSLS